MLDKIKKRVFDPGGSISVDENQAWLERNCQSFADLASDLDADLWAESEAYAASLHAHADRVLADVEVSLGGGGFYPLLYFVTRRRRPDVVVETGVAAGYSSAAVLAALGANDSGQLYSSDFPYFRLANPERYIGSVVEPALKQRWTLHIDGDHKALPRIAAAVPRIDLFHYDSDKSYQGRRAALDVLAPRFTDRTVLVMDDIQDNPFFHDWVAQTQPAHWAVHAFEGKYIGTVGAL